MSVALVFAPFRFGTDVGFSIDRGGRGSDHIDVELPELGRPGLHANWARCDVDESKRIAKFEFGVEFEPSGGHGIRVERDSSTYRIGVADTEFELTERGRLTLWLPSVDPGTFVTRWSPFSWAGRCSETGARAYDDDERLIALRFDLTLDPSERGAS